MLAELQVSELGVIADLTLVLRPGLTALTGETGAGKTLVVEAIELLLGGRADSVQVRKGATSATVEGRFAASSDAPDDLVLARTVPVEGRSRGYINTKMAPLSALRPARAPVAARCVGPARRTRPVRFGGHWSGHRCQTAASRR